MICDFVVKPLGVALVLMLAASGATGQNSRIANSPVNQPLRDAEVICSALILGTWPTSDGVNRSSFGASESGRAEVDKVLKGSLSHTKITFQGDRQTVPNDFNSGPGVDANSITLTRDLRPGTRYMLFLSTDPANGHNSPTYRLDFSIPLTPTGTPICDWMAQR